MTFNNNNKMWNISNSTVTRILSWANSYFFSPKSHLAFHSETLNILIVFYRMELLFFSKILKSDLLHLKY